MDWRAPKDRTRVEPSDPASGSRSARQPLRRRGAPATRAAAGGLLVAGAMLAAILLSGGSPATDGTPVVVAATDLPPGSSIGPEDIDLQLVALPDPLASRTYADPALVVGAVTTAALDEGDLVQRSALRFPGGGGADRYELAVEVASAEAIGGDLRRGEVVVVLSTGEQGAAPRSEVVAPDATVLEVGERSGASLAAAGSLVVRLAVPSLAEAAAVASAGAEGAIVLVRPPAAEVR